MTVMTGTGGNRSYCHRGGEQPLLGTTIPEHFAATAARHPDTEAVVALPQQRRLSYRELSGEVDRLARGLLGIGLGQCDRVGIWSTNNIEWLLLQLATARIGAVLVNINPAYRPREQRLYRHAHGTAAGTGAILRHGPVVREPAGAAACGDLRPGLACRNTTPAARLHDLGRGAGSR
jgi:non-ribosomal peptide synthetase component E (peptide arylation enzyme)